MISVCRIFRRSINLSSVLAGTIKAPLPIKNPIFSSAAAAIHPFSQYLPKTLLSSQVQPDEQRSVKNVISGLERSFSRFEERCQRAERVNEKDFVKIFDTLTRVVEQLEATNSLNDDIKLSISLLAAILLRCCGRLMSDSSEKVRELLAGNLWQYIKEKKIPLDISHYNSLIRVLNENETNFDPQKMLDEISAAKLIPDRITYQRLIHQHCVQGNINGATSLLEKMKDLGMELNELTFASLIIGYSKQENPPSITEMFDLMRSNNVEPGGKSYTSAILSKAKLMVENPTEAEAELGKIYELLEQDEIQFSVYEMTDIMNSLLPSKTLDSAAKILKYIGNVQLGGVNARYRVFSTLLRSGEFDEVSKLYWQQKPSEKALSSGGLGLYYIKLLATFKNVPIEHSIKECSKLKELSYNNRAFYHLYYFAAENGNLNLVRAALEKIADEEQLKCQYFWPLLAQAENEQDIINCLKNDLNPNMDTNDLLDTFSQWVWPRFSDNISKLFVVNSNELHYDANLLMASFLNYAVQENKIMEAIKFISETPDELLGATPNSAAEDEGNLEPIVTPRMRPSNDRDALIGRLLNQIAEQTKDAALVNKAFNLCQLPGQQINSRTASALVKVHLLNDDFDGALEAFLKIAHEHRLTPCKRDLIIHCLEKKNPDSLQKIMNASTELHGETNSLFDLALCCLVSGKLKQAQKIFASPGFRVNPLRVYQASRQLASQSNINVLENFVHLARDMYDVNQEHLYQVLIDVYERTGNGRRVLDLWNRMQEEEFQPSKRSLLMIAKVLEKNNIEVPFQKPKVDLRGRND